MRAKTRFGAWVGGWMDGWMVGSRSCFKDCLQQSKNFFDWCNLRRKFTKDFENDQFITLKTAKFIEPLNFLIDLGVLEFARRGLT